MQRPYKRYPTNENGARKSPWMVWLQAISHLIFPPRCQVCGGFFEFQDKGLICDCCYKKITFLHEPNCSICGLMFLKSGGSSHLCARCAESPPSFYRAISVVRYSKEVAVLIQKFKFSGDLSVLPIFNQWGKAVFYQYDYADYIFPVPLHPQRIKKRGFNQASLLAGLFFPTQKHKIRHFLRRIVNTPPQSKLDGERRRENLKDCFKLIGQTQVVDKIIYLVDDVYTTGTTVNECAKVLIQAGARRVEVFTLAMVVKENE